MGPSSLIALLILFLRLTSTAAFSIERKCLTIKLRGGDQSNLLENKGDRLEGDSNEKVLSDDGLSSGPKSTQSSANNDPKSFTPDNIWKGITASFLVTSKVVKDTKKSVAKFTNASLRILRSIIEILHVKIDSLGEKPYELLHTLVARPNEDTKIILAVFAICLLGTSVGFRSYLYFVSVGQSVCIGLVSMISLITFNVLSRHPIPILTSIQSFLVVLWSFRLTYFLLHREYVNWPERHQQLKEVDKRAKTKSKFSVWWTCASFYAMMIMPCIYKLKAAFHGSHRAAWGKIGKIGIIMQFFGLSLETVADHQKGAFKIREGNRNLWCNEGVWKYSIHPNYMGEITFWVGTYLGSMACYTNLLQWFVCTMGLCFSLTVMKSAIETLNLKQLRKYGLDEKFVRFRQTHGVFGPFKLLPHKEQALTI